MMTSEHVAATHPMDAVQVVSIANVQSMKLCCPTAECPQTLEWFKTISFPPTPQVVVSNFGLLYGDINAFLTLENAKLRLRWYSELYTLFRCRLLLPKHVIDTVLSFCAVVDSPLNVVLLTRVLREPSFVFSRLYPELFSFVFLPLYTHLVRDHAAKGYTEMGIYARTKIPDCKLAFFEGNSVETDQHQNDTYGQYVHRGHFLPTPTSCLVRCKISSGVIKLALCSKTRFDSITVKLWHQPLQTDAQDVFRCELDGWFWYAFTLDSLFSEEIRLMPFDGCFNVCELPYICVDVLIDFGTTRIDDDHGPCLRIFDYAPFEIDEPNTLASFKSFA